MSDLLFKVCPKCKRLMPVGNGSTLCTECAEKARMSRKRDRDYRAEYEARKDDEDPRYRKFYRSKEWRMTSRKYLQKAGYVCEVCGRQGTDVHHIAPIQTPEGWERRFDFDNLKLLCVSCHNDAHGRTFRNGWGDADATGKAEETARDAEGAPLERGESGEGRAGSGHKVSDYRL